MTDAPPLRSAEIIAVGSEMLGSTRIDTNSLFLAERLASLGIDLRAKTVVGDAASDLADVLPRRRSARADLVILTGGLGPTDDDLTRDVVAEVLGLPMRRGPGDRRGASRALSRAAACGCRQINRRQAMVPRGATVLDNPNGSAPGLLIRHVGERVVVLLPGPPREMKPMFEAVAASALRRARRRASASTARRCSSPAVRESHVEEAIQPIYAPLAHARAADRDDDPGGAGADRSAPDGAVATTPAAADGALASARDRMVAAIGDDAFSVDGRSMEEIVGDLLRERGCTIAVAESCTRRPAAVAADRRARQLRLRRCGGVVAYSNDAKTAFADVPADLIASTARSASRSPPRWPRASASARARRRRRHHRHCRAGRRHAAEAGRDGRARVAGAAGTVSARCGSTAAARRSSSTRRRPRSTWCGGWSRGMRLFVGIELGDSLADAVEAAVARLRSRIQHACPGAHGALGAAAQPASSRWCSWAKSPDARGGGRAVGARACLRRPALRPANRRVRARFRPPDRCA